MLLISCYCRKSINNIPCDIALRLRRICDTDEKFNSRSIEYKNYLIAREYKPSIVKYFANVSTLSRLQARQKFTNQKSQVSKNVKLIMKYDPRLPDLNSLLKKHMPLLYTDLILKTIFSQGCINSVFKRNQSLKELLAPSLCPNKKVNRANSIASCNKCDVCENYFHAVSPIEDIIRGGILHCTCNHVFYLITCENCLQQYVGSATNLKIRFKIHKSDIKTNKDRCGTAKHFNGMCKNDNNIFQFLSVQIIAQVCSNATNIEEILWHREKYWQS